MTSGSKNPGAALRRLEELFGQAGPNIFERVRLATELLDNRHWLDHSEYKGDQAAAAEALQEKFFRDIGKLISIFRLCDVFRRFPEEKEWRALGYDLKAMWFKYQEATSTEGEKEKPRAQRHTAKLKELEATQEKVTDLEFRLKKADISASDKDAMIVQLRQEVERLKLENAELRGENRQLRVQLGQKGRDVA